MECWGETALWTEPRSLALGGLWAQWAPPPRPECPSSLSCRPPDVAPGYGHVAAGPHPQPSEARGGVRKEPRVSPPSPGR